MNIFVTDRDPKIAAESLDDKRVVKMVLESAQMLSTALHELAPHLWKALLSESQDIHTYQGYKTVYFPTHVNHPCNKWVRASEENFTWLWLHASHLLAVYTNVYERRHASATCINLLGDYTHDCLPQTPMTPFPNCARNKDLGLDFTHIEDVHEAYRQYLKARWARDVRAVTWGKRAVPAWMLG